MTIDVIPVETGRMVVSTEIADLLREAAGLVEEARASSTVSAYENRLRAYGAFCTQHDLPVLGSAESVAAFVAQMVEDGVSSSTLVQTMAAIRWAHHREGLVSVTDAPVVKQLIAGAKRRLGGEAKKSKAVDGPVLRGLLDTCDGSMLGIRDAALLSFAFWTGLRVSSLMALNLEDLDFVEQGVEVRLVNGEKNDQERLGRTVLIPRQEDSSVCGVTLLKRWIAAAGLTGGALWRGVSPDRSSVLAGRLTRRSALRALKGRVTAAGLPEGDYTFHGLRSGSITAMITSGASVSEAMAQSGHKSVDVMQGYVRVADRWSHNGITKVRI